MAISDRSLEEQLLGIFFDDDLLELEDDGVSLDGVRTFAEVGLLTNDRGLVLSFTDGSVFNLTIQRAR